MATFEVITDFGDLQDCNHIYHQGDAYPRNGYAPSEDRIMELLTDRNRTHKPLIRMVERFVVGAVVQEANPVVEEQKTIVEEKPKGKRTKKNDAR